MNTKVHSWLSGLLGQVVKSRTLESEDQDSEFWLPLWSWVTWGKELNLSVPQLTSSYSWDEIVPTVHIFVSVKYLGQWLAQRNAKEVFVLRACGCPPSPSHASPLLLEGDL